MTALSAAKNVKQMGTGGEPITVVLPVAASTTIYKGALVCDNGSGYAVEGSTSTALIAVGRAKDTVDNGSGSAGDLNVEVERGCFRFENSSAGDAIAIAQRYDVCFIVDDQTVAKTDGSSTRSRAGIIMDVDSYGVWVLVGTSLILDYSTLETGLSTAETDIDALEAHQVSTDHTVNLSLFDFREVDANGDVGAITANGGILASDTTPILRGDSNQAQEIAWVAADVDPIAIQVGLPDNFDGSADVVLECVLSSGTTDDADLAVETSWDAAAQVADAVVEAGASATPHVNIATIAAADVPDAADRVTIILTPPTHATDAIVLHGIKLKYTGKALT
jgi:hypothetical protein